METHVTRTKSFRELVQRHVKDDAKFAEALLREGVDAMLSGDVETGKTLKPPELFSLADLQWERGLLIINADHDYVFKKQEE